MVLDPRSLVCFSKKLKNGRCPMERCKICRKMPQSALKLTYKKNVEGVYECHFCGVLQKNQNTMHYHLKKHAGLLPHKCKHCDKGFLQKKQLDLHVEAKHPQTLEPGVIYKCPECDFKNKQKGNLFIHYMRIHCIDICCLENGVCGKCSAVFANKTSYYYHAFICNPPTTTHTHYSGYMGLLEMT